MTKSGLLLAAALAVVGTAASAEMDELAAVVLKFPKMGSYTKPQLEAMVEFARAMAATRLCPFSISRPGAETLLRGQRMSISDPDVQAFLLAYSGEVATKTGQDISSSGTISRTRERKELFCSAMYLRAGLHGLLVKN
jgi:hypothetical protein